MVARQACFAHPSLDQPEDGRRTIAAPGGIVRKDYAQRQDTPTPSKKIAASALSTGSAKQKGLQLPSRKRRPLSIQLQTKQGLERRPQNLFSVVGTLPV
jgi:hypothetical protein